MEIQLGPSEARVLGVLIEKQITTPEYYPLTLNAVVAACSQKSNRYPVMEFDEHEAEKALESLRRKELAWQIETAGSRVPRFEHRASEKWHLERSETALLCELLIRGPQTVGELKTHCARMYEFRELRDVEKALQDLENRADGPFVMQLGRKTGQKEIRYIQVLTGVPDPAAGERQAVLLKKDSGTASPRIPGTAEQGDFARLEERVRVLEAEMESLKKRLAPE